MKLTTKQKLKNFIRKEGLLILAIICIFVPPVLRDGDPTDRSRFDRSGLSWYKDYGTGCEYLSIQEGIFGKGQLIPRVNNNGKHICGGK